jgi:hypothetical protein
MTKRGSLSNFAATKPAAPRSPEPSAEAEGQAPPALPPPPRRGQTLRLPPEARRQLKLLAVEQEEAREVIVRQHDLLLEAVNDLFRKYGKPPIAR